MTVHPELTWYARLLDELTRTLPGLRDSQPDNTGRHKVQGRIDVVPVLVDLLNEGDDPELFIAKVKDLWEHDYMRLGAQIRGFDWNERAISSENFIRYEVERLQNRHH